MALLLHEAQFSRTVNHGGLFPYPLLSTPVPTPTLGHKPGPKITDAARDEGIWFPHPPLPHHIWQGPRGGQRGQDQGSPSSHSIFWALESQKVNSSSQGKVPCHPLPIRPLPRHSSQAKQSCAKPVRAMHTAGLSFPPQAMHSSGCPRPSLSHAGGMFPFTPGPPPVSLGCWQN